MGGLGVPLGGMVHGDLCRRLDGRKYYLEASKSAVITARNVSVTPNNYARKMPRILWRPRWGGLGVRNGKYLDFSNTYIYILN